MRQRIWTFLNSPFVVAIWLVLLLSLVFYFGFMRGVAGLFSKQELRNQRLNVLSKLEVRSYREASNAPGDSQKFVGTLRNHSDYIVTAVTGSLCFYDAKGNLLNVFTTSLGGIGTLAPGGSREFSFTIHPNRDISGPAPRYSGDKIELKLVDLEMQKPALER